MLPGLTKDFEQYLNKQGEKAKIENLIDPVVEPMPADIAAMFGQPEGVHLVHRLRRQGTLDQPLRLGEIWYPASLAAEFLDAMRQDEHMNVLDAIDKAHGVHIVEHEDTILARIPTVKEARDLNIVRTEPVFELRRKNYAQDGTIVMFNRQILVAPHFQLIYRQPVKHWNK
jgi:DNA-binding GntR family transcriptional regulator